MLKEILSISGKPGLYRLVSKAKNLLVVESIADKKRVPAYAHDRVITLADVSIYSEEGDASIVEALTGIRDKEGGKQISFDFRKASSEELHEYFATVMPTFDRAKVYPTDIKKILKWYNILVTAGITEYAPKVPAAPVSEEATSEEEAVSEEKEAKKPAAAKAVSATKSGKRKDTSATSSKATTKVKSTPKPSAPKKSVVGAKRGG